MTITQAVLPQVPLINLTTLWFQVSGTFCNLECRHCFISCGPGVSRHRMMTRNMVNGYLNEARDYGVKEFYITGGEPFLNPELIGVVEDMLLIGDVTLLTNGTLITRDKAFILKRLSDDSPNCLTLRISIESPVEEDNDRVRGKGSFRMAVRGIRNLLDAGINPIITVTKMGEEGEIPLDRFRSWLVDLGAVEPQLKTLPIVYLGRAGENIRRYRDDERVAEKCFDNFSKKNLQCSYCRMITSEGVYVCPILIDDPGARLADRLGDALIPYELESQACYTCRTAGLCCSNTEISHDDVRKFYGRAAENPQPSLCCPTIYEGIDTAHIPEEVFKISYGCGSPVTLAGIKRGETMLDLGSGGGIDCFIASKMVGPSGRVIGIDMTDEMLSKAEINRGRVAENLGYDNVEFKRGLLEAIPVRDRSVNVVTSNCVINLSIDKGSVFREIYRILKGGGRFVISDIVSDMPAPEYMRKDRELWGECISGALTMDEFMELAREAGFYGIGILFRSFYREVEGIRFDSVTFQGHKFVKGKRCIYIGQKAVYNGPFSSVSDDDGHIYPAGVPVEICTDTAEKLKKSPYSGLFTVTDPLREDGDVCKPGCC